MFFRDTVFDEVAIKQTAQDLMISPEGKTHPKVSNQQDDDNV
jgi:hypothetical protein